ncbi:hypothetical protein H0H92_005781 [Tricholoma furcatifolium]|nr:hypothetical protein H0H92_005781 [Tricholoma furcatifolium]
MPSGAAIDLGPGWLKRFLKKRSAQTSGTTNVPSHGSGSGWRLKRFFKNRSRPGVANTRHGLGLGRLKRFLNKRSAQASGVSNAPIPQSPPLPTLNTRSARLNTVTDVGRTVLGVVRDSADAFAPLKSVAGGVCAVLDVSQRRDATRESAHQVTNRASRVANALPSGSSSDLAANQLKSQLEEESERMKPIQGRSPLGALFHLNRDESDCRDASRRVDEYCHDFNTIASAKTQVQVRQGFQNLAEIQAQTQQQVQNFVRYLFSSSPMKYMFTAVQTVTVANSQEQTQQGVQNLTPMTEQTHQNVQNLMQMFITVVNSQMQIVQDVQDLKHQNDSKHHRCHITIASVGLF